MEWAVSVLGIASVSDIAGLPVLMIALGGYSLVSMPIENGFSRWRETKADYFALELTGKNLAKASALTRAANQNLGEINPEKWVVWLFYDHPPLGERIDKARSWKPAQ
jgi:Zn-dependent protease with chaperone function